MINLPTPKYFVTFSFEIVHTFPKNGPNNKNIYPSFVPPSKNIWNHLRFGPKWNAQNPLYVPLKIWTHLPKYHEIKKFRPPPLLFSFLSSRNEMQNFPQTNACPA